MNKHETPNPKRGWMIIFAGLAIVGVSSIALSLFYREWPKQSETLEHRSLKPIYSSYLLALSATDSAFAEKTSSEIVGAIGSDSSITKMVVTGSAVHKQCTSLAEYKQLISRALRGAHPPALGPQSIMLAKVLDIMGADTAQARLYLVGKFGASDLNTIRSEMQNTLNALRLRSQRLGQIDVYLYNRPYPDPLGHSFAEYLREGGFKVEER